MSSPAEQDSRHAQKLALRLGVLLMLFGAAIAAALISAILALSAHSEASAAFHATPAVAAAGVAALSITIAVVIRIIRRVDPVPGDTREVRAPRDHAASHRLRRAIFILLAGTVVLTAVLVFRKTHAAALIDHPAAWTVPIRSERAGSSHERPSR